MPQSPLTGQFLKKSRHLGFSVFIAHLSMKLATNTICKVYLWLNESAPYGLV